MSGWTFHAELPLSPFDWQQIGINMLVHHRIAFSCLGLDMNLDMDLDMNLDICTPVQRPNVYICIRATSVCVCMSVFLDCVDALLFSCCDSDEDTLFEFYVCVAIYLKHICLIIC